MSYVRTEPIINNTSDAIKIKFLKKNRVINSIKGFFFQIYKESTSEFTTIHVTLNCINKIQNCMLSIMTTPKAILGVNQYIMLTDKCTKSLLH